MLILISYVEYFDALGQTNSRPCSARLVIASSERSNIHSYCENPVIEIISERLKYETTMKEGENFFDIIENMHFWGTLKIMKF